MAGVGLSRAYVAKYAHDGNGVVSYTGGANLGPAVSYSTEIDQGDDNNLYGDNGVVESVKMFVGGTLTHSTTDITQESSALILGMIPQKVTAGGKEVEVLVYDDDIATPYLGFGTIIKKIVDNHPKWVAVLLTKIKYNIPNDAATTQGESIEWQKPELTATIMRDDTPKHAWMKKALFDSEADADAFIQQMLGITAPPTGG